MRCWPTKALLSLAGFDKSFSGILLPDPARNGNQLGPKVVVFFKDLSSLLASSVSARNAAVPVRRCWPRLQWVSLSFNRVLWFTRLRCSCNENYIPYEHSGIIGIPIYWLVETTGKYLPLAGNIGHKPLPQSPVIKYILDPHKFYLEHFGSEW